jgi:Mrp family chromosome partitioning ATPase
MQGSGPPADWDEPSALPVENAEILPETRLAFHADPRSPGADRYRLLRMRLRELGSSGKLKTLLVTSPLPHDGKSTVCLNLATALAEGGKKNVLLIEADLHQPVVNASELLQTAALAGVMSKLLPRFDWIIVDSPPVLPLSDATSLTRYADATLLVARADQTVREAIDETIAIIGRQRIVGIVLNGVNSFDRSYSKYYKSYYSPKAPRSEHNNG